MNNETEIPFPYPTKSSEERISNAYLAASKAIQDLKEEMDICENVSERRVTLSAVTRLSMKVDTIRLNLICNIFGATKEKESEHGNKLVDICCEC